MYHPSSVRNRYRISFARDQHCLITGSMSTVEARGQILPATFSPSSTNYKPDWGQKAFPTETEYPPIPFVSLVLRMRIADLKKKNIPAELQDLSGLTQIWICAS